MAGNVYAGRIAHIDLENNTIQYIDTLPYVEKFIGGRGLAAKIYWDYGRNLTDAFDPRNPLIFTTGPLMGFSGLSAGRWQICGKSPATTEQWFSFANLGGHWGAQLKSAGLDGFFITGKSQSYIYIIISEGNIVLHNASKLWGKNTFQTLDLIRDRHGQDLRVLSIGPAGENLVTFSTVNADDGSSGSAGFGAVLGSKKVKAIAVRKGRFKPKAADPKGLKRIVKDIYNKRHNTWGDWFKEMIIPGRSRSDKCAGCITGCYRQSYKADDRHRYKYFCQPWDVYRRQAEKYYGEGHETALLGTRLCDLNGLDTIVMQPLLEWLGRCNKHKILTKKDIDLDLDDIGSTKFIYSLIQKILSRQGFWDLVAQNLYKAASSLGEQSSRLLNESIATDSGENRDYDPRLIITNSIFYATEPRRPIQQLHEIAETLIQWLQWREKQKGSFLSGEVFARIAELFWGGSKAADLTTLEGKALAAKKIQDREYVKECMIFCDMTWPVLWVRDGDDHLGDPKLESRVFSTITGREYNEDSLNRVGERIFNLQRAILLDEGWLSKRGDSILPFHHETPIQYVRYNRECIVPGRGGKPVSRQGEVLRRNDFMKLKLEYYSLRGWNKNGVPEAKILNDLGLSEITNILTQKKLFNIL